MHVMAAKDGVLVRRRLRIFAAAVALVLLCAVCVGGVSGYEFTASTEEELRIHVSAANANNEADTIIITNNIVLSQSTPITISNGQIIIKSADGESYTISRHEDSNSDELNFVFFQVPTYSPIFTVTGGELVLSGSKPRSLILNGNGLTMQRPGGGAVYVNGGSFVMNDGVQLTNFGYLGSAYTGSGSGAVYVNSGLFTMNGGLIDNNRAAVGGGVYVASYAEFVMTGGKITGNGHNGILITGESYGGGVYIQENGYFSQSVHAEIIDNLGDPANVVYNDPGTTISYWVTHSFQNWDGEYIIDDSRTEKMEGSISTPSSPHQMTNAQPASVEGYRNKPINQVELKEGDEDIVVNVEYDIYITYKITIPDTLVIAEDTNTGTLTLTPSELWILDTGEVVVSVTSKYDFNLVYGDDSNVRITYNLLKDDTTIQQGNSIAGFTLENPTPVSISAEVTGHPPYVGSYNDVLTFTAEYIDPTMTQT